MPLTDDVRYHFLSDSSDQPPILGRKWPSFLGGRDVGWWPNIGGTVFDSFIWFVV